MKSISTIKNPKLPLLAVCLSLAGWASWENWNHRRLSQRFAYSQQTAVDQSARAAALQNELTVQVASLQQEAKALKASENSSKSPAAKPDAAKEAIAGMAKMFSDPKMRDMMKTQARMGVDMIYRDLFDLLNLPEPQNSQFEKLIHEKATVGMEAAFAMMGGPKTSEERKSAAAEAKKLMEASDAKMQALLSAEDFAKVKRYEDSQMERMQLRTFRGMLASKDLIIDEVTEAKLMDAMYQERKKFPFASNYVDQQNVDITRFTSENLKRFNEDYSHLNESIEERAAGILSAAQMEVFRQSQAEQMKMNKMNLEMGAKMFGAGSQ